jgi:hypothetical protein
VFSFINFNEYSFYIGFLLSIRRSCLGISEISVNNLKEARLSLSSFLPNFGLSASMKHRNNNYGFVSFVNNVMNHKRKNVQNSSSYVDIPNNRSFRVLPDKIDFFTNFCSKLFAKSILLFVVPFGSF